MAHRVSHGGSGGYDNGHNSTADAAEGNKYNNVPRTMRFDKSASARSNSSSSVALRTEGEAVTVANVVTPTRNCWAQYKTDDLKEESRTATGNAMVRITYGMQSSSMGQTSPEEEESGGAHLLSRCC